MAMRVGVEMMVATLIGAAMGYALDKYLGTRPWLLLVGVLLGGGRGMPHRLSNRYQHPSRGSG